MKKVDFFVVGQPKSGTTALCHFLNQHPEIGISDPKEPGYFASDLKEESDAFHGRARYFPIRDEEAYVALFAKSANKSLWGDGSTNYLFSASAAENIKQYNPQAKILIILREPVDFIRSLHTQYVNAALETEANLEKALSLQSERRQGRFIPKNAVCPSYYQYLSQARSAEQVKRYLGCFPRESILIMTSDEFRENNEAMYAATLKFLGAKDTSFLPEFKTVHGATKPRSKKLNSILNNQRGKALLRKVVGLGTYTKIRKGATTVLMKKAPAEPLSQETRQMLQKELRPDVEQLSLLIDRDLVRLWSYD